MVTLYLNLSITKYLLTYEELSLRFNSAQLMNESYCVKSSIICAGDGKSYAESNNNFTPDSCQGDSGGPLTYQDPYTKR